MKGLREHKDGSGEGKDRPTTRRHPIPASPAALWFFRSPELRSHSFLSLFLCKIDSHPYLLHFYLSRSLDFSCGHIQSKSIP
ncbi:unnamed protein product [Linum tenue]|uniref:Uncharacterized protein n=1 Tax=Linum tenue TaxID=586396 RepID=A0AAV0JZ28_9ROSI|nr:unnamed protein product [Linum tenue]CAI0417048.1 unnamed protein product [Linum tenue]CAI0462338.1 unnamed protein product [Linum tenue]